MLTWKVVFRRKEQAADDVFRARTGPQSYCGAGLGIFLYLGVNQFTARWLR